MADRLISFPLRHFLFCHSCFSPVSGGATQYAISRIIAGPFLPLGCIHLCRLGPGWVPGMESGLRLLGVNLSHWVVANSPEGKSVFRKFVASLTIEAMQGEMGRQFAV